MNPIDRIITYTLLAAATLGAIGCGKPADTAPAPKAAAVKEAEHKEGADEHAETAVIKLSDAEATTAGVKTAKVVEETVRAAITLSATIQPNRARFAHVGPRMPGRILEVPARAGDLVRAGQVLAVLDSVEVGESTSSYQQAASHFNVSKADFERSQKLLDEEVIPQKDYLRARAEFEKSRAALAAATDKLRLMGVKPGAGSASSLSVTAPFAGTVIEKSAVIGELAPVDKALFTVADLSTVWIEANLYEKDLSRVQSGGEAEVSVSAYPDARFKGKLAYVSAVVDRESRTVKVRIEVPNRDGRLKPEMFATAVVQGEERGQAIAVPAQALVLMDNRNVVFVKEADGYEVRPVELGDLVGGRQVIKSGLHAGEEVVIAGTYALKSQQQKSKIGAGHAH